MLVSKPTFLHAFDPFLIISTAMPTLIPIIFGLEVLFVPFYLILRRGGGRKLGGARNEFKNLSMH